MLLNYLITASRLLRRNLTASVINILGLTVAFAGCLLIAVFVVDELSYDRFNEKSDRIYRVTRNYITPEGSVAMHLGHLAAPFAPLLKNDFPELLEVVRTAGPISRSMTTETQGAGNITIENVYFAEPSVLDVFSIHVISGNPKTALERRNTLMISDRAAITYFGSTAVVGKKLIADEQQVEITGVYKALPEQSHWHPDVLMSFTTLNDEKLFGERKLREEFEINAFLTYILVKKDFDRARMEASLSGFIDKHVPVASDSRKQSESTKLILQPLTSVHLHSKLDSEAETNGDITHVYVMGSIGLFLLVIASFNFINLSTASATQRAKEVGLRKISGAMRSQLIVQYLGESTLMVLIAVIIAIALASAGLPWLNAFTGKQIVFTDYLTLSAMLPVGAFVPLLGVLAGIYPAIIISGFQPSAILTGRGIAIRLSSFRKMLVVTQFSISAVMIIATLVVYQQIEYIRSKDVGYAKDQVIAFHLPDELWPRFETYRNSALRNPAIVDLSGSSRIPTDRLLETNYVNASAGSQKTEVIMKNVNVDMHFFDTYGIPILSGTKYQSGAAGYKSVDDRIADGFILNETAARQLGWSADESIGRNIVLGGVRARVIGVVKDFHFESLHQRIAPIVFITYTQNTTVSVRIASSRMKEGIEHLANVWKQFVPKEPFTYEFVDQRYAKLYRSETQQAELFITFASLAIFIACLGLFGLTTFNASQRRKEVSIRKVLGASIADVMALLSKETIVLVVVANVVAWPVAWYAMAGWLSDFAYRVNMSALPFLITGAVTIAITALTISIQTFNTATINPARILQNE